MNRHRRILIQGLIAALLAPTLNTTLAAEAVRIKLATLAPRGSVYHRSLQEMGEAWRKTEGGNAGFIIYTDGSQGGEEDVVRRMRVGQLNAAMLSGVGLSEIDKSVGALQYIPLAFRSSEELHFVMDAVCPKLERRFREKGFEVLFWANAGWVRFFSKEPALHPDDFKGRRLFAWAGNNEHIELIKAMGYRPVAIETGDILPGLQTGLIDTVPAMTMWALATQMDRAAPHMIEMKWAPIVGAVVVTRPAWDAMSPAGREALRQSAAKVGAELRAHQAQADDEAIEAMARRGLHVQRLTPEAEAAWNSLAQRAHPMIRGRTVPADTFDEVTRLVAEYRRNHAQR
jgi:TRAP-type C4-dicarboxylate transport system substrate-binding protein